MEHIFRVSPMFSRWTDFKYGLLYLQIQLRKSLETTERFFLVLDKTQVKWFSYFVDPWLPFRDSQTPVAPCL